LNNTTVAFAFCSAKHWTTRVQHVNYVKTTRFTECTPGTHNNN